MKFPISLKLFLAVLMTSLAVAATGLGMLRDSMQRGFVRYVGEIELKRLEPLAESLVSTYQAQDGWPSLSADEQRHWLADQLGQLRNIPGARFSGLFPGWLGPLPDRPSKKHHHHDHARWMPMLPGDGPAPVPGPLDRAPAGPPLSQPPPPPDRGLSRRIGLIDPSGRLIAGLAPGPDSLRLALQADGRTIGYLTLLPEARPADAIAQAFLLAQHRQLLLIALVCVVLSGLAAALLAANFRRPIRQLVTATGELMHGRFAVRLDSRRRDELGTLAEAVNRLADMLGQHEASRRQWVADTSHELRTPVAVLRAQVEALCDGVRQPDAAQFAAMQRQIAALSRLIDELQQLSQADVGQLTHELARIDPWPVVVAEAESFRPRHAEAGLRLTVSASAAAAPVMADAARLQQVIGNLLENSLRYTDAGGEVRLAAQVEAGNWVLTVDDSAPGVADADLARLGERFFRVERSRSRALGGSGLGLALCRRIVEAHAGQLQFLSSPLGGLRVRLSLPLARGLSS